MNDTKKLFRSSFIIFVGTIVGSLFSYLFNMLMGRLLGPSLYGALTAILSLLAIIGVTGSAIITIAMRYSGELFHQHRTKALQRLFSFLTKNIFYAALILFFIGLILAKPIANFLAIDQIWPVIIALTSVIFSLLIAINRGFLQGTLNFKSVSVIAILEMALRLGLGVLLVVIGFKLFGAVIAIVLATAITYGVAFIPLKNILRKADGNKEEVFKFDRKEILAYSWPTLLTALTLAVALNLDIILVKHYFDPETAGLYAAVSTVAKIVLYITAPIVSVMFPMISQKTVKGDKHYRIFLMSLLLTMIGGLAILAVYVLAPSKILSILYGAKYTAFFQLLPEAGLFVLFYALSNLVINYYLVIKDFTFLIFYGLVLISQIILIILWHPSLLFIVQLLIASNGFLFIILISYYLWSKRKQVSQFLKGEYES